MQTAFECSHVQRMIAVLEQNDTFYNAECSCDQKSNKAGLSCQQLVVELSDSSDNSTFKS